LKKPRAARISGAPDRAIYPRGATTARHRAIPPGAGGGRGGGEGRTDYHPASSRRSSPQGQWKIAEWCERGGRGGEGRGGEGNPPSSSSVAGSDCREVGPPPIPSLFLPPPPRPRCPAPIPLSEREMIVPSIKIVNQIVAHAPIPGPRHCSTGQSGRSRRLNVFKCKR